MHPRIVWAIARKDLMDAIKNSYIFFALLLPVGMSLFFRVLMPSGGDAMGLTVAVYDPGGSSLARQISAAGNVNYFGFDSEAAVADKVKKDASGGLAIPAGFDAQVAAGQTPAVKVYYNSRRGGGEQAAFRNLVETALRQAADQRPPAQLVTVDASGEGGASSGRDIQSDLAGFYLVLLVVMSVSMTGAFVVPTLLVEEKEKQTLRAVLVSPASYGDVVLGKGMVGLIYAVLGAVLLLILNNGLRGNPALTLLAVFLGSLFLVLVGLLMAAIFSTTQQVNTWSSFVMLLFMVPGMFGSFLPPPGALRTAMRVIPTSYMASAIEAGVNNRPWSLSVAVDLVVLAAVALAAFGAVVWFLRRERQ